MVGSEDAEALIKPQFVNIHVLFDRSKWILVNFISYNFIING